MLVNHFELAKSLKYDKRDDKYCFMNMWTLEDFGSVREVLVIWWYGDLGIGVGGYLVDILIYKYWEASRV